MRADKWLWMTRFFRSRSLAAEVLAGRGLRINGQKTDRPAHALPPFDAEATGSAVIRDLYDRGATFSEIDVAGLAAFVLCRDFFEGVPQDDDKPEHEEVSEIADFSEAPAHGSESK